MRETGSGPTLSIGDDGHGLPADFDPASRRGLGMRVIGMLACQLGAILEFGSNANDRGTCFTLHVAEAGVR